MLKHAPQLRLPRLTTHCGPMTPLVARVWPSGAGKTSQAVVCAHLLATRSAGWRVPASTRADATAQTRDHLRAGQASSSPSAQRTPLHDADHIRLPLLPCLVVRSP
jgi:hypothetical protein